MFKAPIINGGSLVSDNIKSVWPVPMSDIALIKDIDGAKIDIAIAEVRRRRAADKLRPVRMGTLGPRGGFT